MSAGLAREGLQGCSRSLCLFDCICVRSQTVTICVDIILPFLSHIFDQRLRNAFLLAPEKQVALSKLYDTICKVLEVYCTAIELRQLFLRTQSAPHLLKPDLATGLEGRQPELVSTVLGAEDAEKEAVHAQQDAAPEKDGKLLRPGVSNAGNLEGKRDGREREDTIDGSNDLRLKTELVAEASGKIAESTFSIALNIWGLPDVVEHMSAGEEQHGDQAECSPQVAVLEHRRDIWPGDRDKRDATEHEDGHGADLDPVDGAGDGGLGSIGGDLARDPVVDLFGGLRARGEVEADGLGVRLCVGANGGVEEEEDRCGLEHHLCFVSTTI